MHHHHHAPARAQAPHTHDPHDHHPHPVEDNTRPFIAAIIITVIFAVIELLGGYWAHSLALISDAGHMVTDATALVFAAIAARIAQRPPNARHTFGYGRATIAGAFANCILMAIVVTSIASHAVQRLLAPAPVDPTTVMIVAAAGLIVNVLVAKILHAHPSHDLNARAAWLHVITDLLGSLAALIAGLAIYFGVSERIDPLLSLLVCGLMSVASIRLFRDALDVVMESVPAGLELAHVEQHMREVPGVHDIHDLHIWTLAAHHTALSAHVVCDLTRWPDVQNALAQCLHDDFDIHHVTLQPEPLPLGTVKA